MTRTARNWTYLTALTIVRAFMLAAAVASFTHIVHTAHMLGLSGWQALSTPFMIDGFAALGMLGRSHRFAESTRRVGMRFAIAAGTLSLAANIYAGTNAGERIYGGLVVAAFIAAEQYADRMKPAEHTTEDPAIVDLRDQLAAATDALAAAQAIVAAEAARAAAAEQAAEATRAATAKELRSVKTRTTRELKKMREELAARDYLAADVLAETSDAPASGAPYGANAYM